MTPAQAAPPDVAPAPVPARVLRKLYLTLFLRGRSARALQHQSAPKSLGRKLALALAFYGMYGAFALFFRHQTVLALSVYLHGMSFLFLGMFVASSAGEVLFNKEEADILLHRPVTARAMLWAKISVMVQVSLWLALALNLVGLFVGMTVSDSGWRYPVVHVASTIVEALFCTGVIVLSYQLCLRWFGRERLDGLMTTAQVFVSIFVIVGGQLLPRMMGDFSQTRIAQLDAWWVAMVPPMWFASLDDAVAGRGLGYSWILAGVGILATALVLAFAFGKLAQSYESGLQKLNETLPSRPGRLRRRWINALLNIPPLCWWLRNPITRASFLLTTAYMVRDRDVKLRLYPGIAPILILPVIFLLQANSRGGNHDNGFGLAFAGGYIGLIPLLAQNILQYSQNWAAADLFQLAPIIGPGAVCDGARKAVVLFLTMPLVLLMVTIALALHASLAQLALFLPGILTIPVLSLVPGVFGGAVPLSKAPEDAKAANRGFTMILMMLGAVALSAVASVAWSGGWFRWFLVAETAVLAVVYVYFLERLKQSKWESLE